MAGEYVTPLPPAPQRGQPPAIFSPTADAFLGALPLFGQQLDALGLNASTWADDAETAAAIAQLAAATATGAPGTNSTSSTPMNIGTGSRSFTTAAGKIYPPGVTVVIARTSAPSNQMIGVVQSYNSVSGAMVVQVNSIAGSGSSITDWTIAVVPAGTVGIPFNTASVGDLWLGNDNQKSVTVATLMGAAIPQVISETSTIILDFSAGWNYVTPLTASRTIGKPVGSRAGMTYLFDLINNGSGLATWDTCFEFGIEGLPTLSTINGKRDRVVLSCYDATIGAPKFNCGFRRAA